MTYKEKLDQALSAGHIEVKEHNRLINLEYKDLENWEYKN